MANVRDIVGMGIDDTNNLVFAWYADGTVTAGSSRDLSSKREARKYTLPQGKKPSDIVGMGIDGTNNLVFAWYDDGTVSAGSSTDLSAKRSPEEYELPAGKTPRDIVGTAIDGRNNLCFAWYRDGTVSAGSSRDLGSKRQPDSYALAAGKRPDDVVDIGIDGLAEQKLLSGLADLIGEGVSPNEDDESAMTKIKSLFDEVTKSLVFVWYQDGTVSAGTSREMAKVRVASHFTT
jgi:hypothetical protein